MRRVSSKKRAEYVQCVDQDLEIKVVEFSNNVAEGYIRAKRDVHVRCPAEKGNEDFE